MSSKGTRCVLNKGYLESVSQRETVLVDDSGDVSKIGRDQEAIRVRERYHFLGKAGRLKPISDVVDLRRRKQQTRFSGHECP